MSTEADRFEALLELVRRLRGEGGCPWDREQTPETIKTYVLEECYELIEAVEMGNADEVREELGDLLFQLLFLGELYRESGGPGISQALETSRAKMVRRHPHVFGEAEARTAGEVVQRWHRLKEEEGKDPLESIPRSLPALLRAHRVGERAAKIGFDHPDAKSALTKLEEEVSELRAAVEAEDRERASKELGDVLFSAVNTARLLKLSAEDALRSGLDKFTRRFREVERRLKSRGKNISEATLAEMDAVWDELRREED